MKQSKQPAVSSLNAMPLPDKRYALKYPTKINHKRLRRLALHGRLSVSHSSALLAKSSDRPHTSEHISSAEKRPPADRHYRALGRGLQRAAARSEAGPSERRTSDTASLAPQPSGARCCVPSPAPRELLPISSHRRAAGQSSAAESRRHGLAPRLAERRVVVLTSSQVKPCHCSAGRWFHHCSSAVF